MSFSWRCDAGDPISFVAVLLIASPSMLLICAVTREVSLSVPMTADSASWAAWGLVAVLILLFLLGLPPASDASTVLVMGVLALAASLSLELSLAAVAVFLPRAASLPVPITADSASLAAGGLVSVLMLLGLPPASDGSTVLMIGVPALAAPLLLVVLLVAVAVFLPCAAFLPVLLTADSASWAAGGLVAVLIPPNLLGLPPAADGLMELTMVAPALAASLAVFPFLVAHGVVLPVAVSLASLAAGGNGSPALPRRALCHDGFVIFVRFWWCVA
jgi:hypothetical protein